METNGSEIKATVHERASVNVTAIVLPRATWQREMTAGGLALRPRRGTWHAHVVRGKSAHDVTVVAMLSCPNCGGLTYLSHSPEASRALRMLTGKPVPVIHSIDHLGKVSPDVLCQHGRCDFHRTVYLDRWNKTKPLFAIAYTRGEHGKIEIAYSHSVDAREARNHLGFGDYRIIAAGKAIGFFVDERTGRVTAD